MIQKLPGQISTSQISIHEPLDEVYTGALGLLGVDMRYSSYNALFSKEETHDNENNVSLRGTRASYSRTLAIFHVRWLPSRVSLPCQNNEWRVTKWKQTTANSRVTDENDNRQYSDRLKCFLFASFPASLFFPVFSRPRGGEERIPGGVFPYPSGPDRVWVQKVSS